MDLVLRPSGIHTHPWSLQLRSHTSLGETEYLTLWRGSREVADMIMEAEAASWLFGTPTAPSALNCDEPRQKIIAGLGEAIAVARGEKQPARSTTYSIPATAQPRFIGMDLASGPDVTAFKCGKCGHIWHETAQPRSEEEEEEEEEEAKLFLAELEIETKKDEIGDEARKATDMFLARDIPQMSVRRRVAAIIAGFARNQLARPDLDKAAPPATAQSKGEE